MEAEKHYREVNEAIENAEAEKRAEEIVSHLEG